MNVPMSWLKAYTDIDCTTDEFIEIITKSGSKVETVTNLGKEIINVVVGKVLSIEKHPNADKLVITKVDVSQSEPLQIVTGATNLYEGAYVPVALNGSTLPNGVKIKTGKLRGVESQGMMCSISELNLTLADCPEAVEDGIYIFPEEQPLGEDVKKIFGLDEDVVEYEITSNRPDCFSVIGIAREAAATFNKPLRFPEIKVKQEAEGNVNDYISVEIKNPELCPRYACRIVKNIKIEPSPRWMRQRLKAAGLRPINNFVDITNYVMLELGQPMHAFDIDTIDESKIIVRNAKDKEEFVTLDGNKRVLDSSMLVISDINKAVAIAGVMGGENSKVNPNARAILFESANFNGPNIRITAKKLGMRTDASATYEKGLDPNLVEIALNRAVQLVEELGAGEVVKGMVDCYPNKKEPWTVEYTKEGINKLLGTDISHQEMVDLLARVEVKADINSNLAVIPTFRPDLQIEADLAEEVARLYGYDNIETTLAAGTPTVGKKSYSQKIEELVSNTLIGLGLCEAMTYSFDSPKVFDKLKISKDSPLRKTVTISNPLGEDFSIMRTIALNGILQSLSTNYNRRNEEAMLFDMATVYLPKSVPVTQLPEERNQLVIGIYGKYDFYDLKGIVEAMFETVGIKDIAEFSPETEIPYMHPGRTANIIINDDNIGYIGELHPDVCENYSIGTKVYIAVIDMPKLIEYSNLERQYKPLPKFPSISRDIAMLIKEDVPVSNIKAIIKQRGGKFIEEINLFDVYTGKQIQQGYKSVAYSIIYRASDHTLTDEEVNSSMKKILKGLETELGAQLRDK